MRSLRRSTIRDEYEAKVSGLLHRAYARLKKENPEAARQWKQAIGEISNGDHYLPVLWAAARDEPGQIARPKGDSLKLFGASLLITAVLLGMMALADHYGIHWASGARGSQLGTQTRMPVWLQRVLVFGLAGTYIYFAVVPLVLKKSLPKVGELWSEVFGGGAKRIDGDG
jgi:hypothetical protein